VKGGSWFLIVSLFFGAVPPDGMDALAAEEARYRIVQKTGSLELREYEPQIVAQTVVEGDFNQGGDIGIARLLGYVSGDNAKKLTIPMTAQVTLEELGKRWQISLLMPSELAWDDLPEPLDNTVSLKRIPGRTMAAVSCSGPWNRTRYEEQRCRLEDLVRKRGLRPLGGFAHARYDPPFNHRFPLRYEVLVTVEPDRKDSP